MVHLSPEGRSAQTDRPGKSAKSPDRRKLGKPPLSSGGDPSFNIQREEEEGGEFPNEPGWEGDKTIKETFSRSASRGWEGKEGLGPACGGQEGEPPPSQDRRRCFGVVGIPGSRQHVVESEEEEGVAAGGAAAAAACEASWPHCEAAQGRGSGGGKEGSALALPHARTHNRSRSGPSEKAACQTLTKEPV